MSKLPSLVKVHKQYLPVPKQAALFNALKNGPWHRLLLRYKNVAKRKNIVFYEGDPEIAAIYAENARDPEEPIPYDQGPPQLRALRERVQREYDLPCSLCYINSYADETVGIGWHNDSEEIGSATPVKMLCLGGTRTLSIWKVRKDLDGKLKEPYPEWEVVTEGGDLVEMQVGFHEEDAYRHAVLPQKAFAPERMSLTFRSPDLVSRRVWECREGAKHPTDAVYVGCVVNRGGKAWKGTIFGNAQDPFKPRNKNTNPWVATNEDDFRAYAERKLKDPPFRKEAEKLVGKHLLCWCKQDGPNRAPFCHARVWLDLVNREVSRG